jgi:hypothetical protein
MIKLIAPIFLCTLVLTGCGGGGEGGSSTTASPTVSPVSGLTEVTRTTTTSLNLINTLTTGDLNNDGRDDIVVGGWVNDGTHTARIYVFYQNADGTLTEKTTEVLPSNTYSGSQRIFIADFDGDGRNDIVLPGFDDGSPQPPANTVIFWNNSGQFIRQDLTDQVYAHGACYNDIDRDGDLDMLVGGGGVYINQGNRNFTIRTNILPNNFFSTCSVVHNQNHTISILLGNSNQVPGFASSILTLDSNFNTVSQVGVALPNTSVHDLVNSRAMDVNNDGHSDFVAVFNQLAASAAGAKQVLIGDGQGNFTAQPAFDTTYNNSYYSHTIFTGGHVTILFGAENGDMKMYQIINGVFTLYKQSVLDSMVQTFGLTQGNWQTGHGTIYQNTVNGRVYVLQYLLGKYYTREL